MGQIPEVEIQRDSEGRRVMRRVMTADMIREREQLNVENTASRLRRRVLALQNGQTSSHPDIPWEHRA